MWAIMSNTTNYVLDNAAVQRVGQIDGVTLHEVKPISEDGVAEFVVTYQGENYRFLAALDPVDLTHVFENQRCDFTDDELAQLQGTKKNKLLEQISKYKAIWQEKLLLLGIIILGLFIFVEDITSQIELVALWCDTLLHLYLVRHQQRALWNQIGLHYTNSAVPHCLCVYIYYLDHHWGAQLFHCCHF